MKRFLAAAALIALFALTVPSTAQDPARREQPRGTFGETVEVRVIDVEVVVTDREGRRVVGLGREDFRLFVDGRETPLAFFDEVREGSYVRDRPAPGEAAAGPAGEAAAAAPALPALPAAPETRYLLFVDDYFTRPPQRNQVLRELRDDLAGLAAQDSLAIVAWDGRRLDVVSDWSGSQREIDDALAAAMERDGWRAFIEQQRARGNPAQLADLLADQLERTYGAVATALTAFSDVSGRRVALVLSGGWPDRVTSDELDPIGRSRLFQTGGALQTVADVANAAGWTLYTVDAPGSESGGGGVSAALRGSSITQRFADEWGEENRHRTLVRLAAATGGEAQLDGGRLRAFQRAVEDTRSYYWLGFEYQRRGDGGRRDVRVAVERPGLEVRARGGFLDVSPIVEAELRAEQVLLLGAGDAPELPVDLGPPRRAGLGKVELPFTVHLPLSQLDVVRGPDGTPRLALELRLTVEDGKGGRSDLATIPLRLTLDTETMARGEALFEAAIELRKRKHVLVFTLTDRVSERTLVARLDFDPR